MSMLKNRCAATGDPIGFAQGGQLRRAFGRYNKEFMAAIAQGRHEFRTKNLETGNVGPKAQ
jgi:hypothetical protein